MGEMEPEQWDMMNDSDRKKAFGDVVIEIESLRKQLQEKDAEIEELKEEYVSLRKTLDQEDEEADANEELVKAQAATIDQCEKLAEEIVNHPVSEGEINLKSIIVGDKSRAKAILAAIEKGKK